MKSSTRKDSSQRKSIKATVAGLAFWPAKRPDNFFPSLQYWIEKGRPANAYIYDSVDTLLASSIPIVDATHNRGVWVSTKRLGKPKEVTLTLHRSFVVPVRVAEAVKTVKGIKTSDTKDHHKMSYN